MVMRLAGVATMERLLSLAGRQFYCIRTNGADAEASDTNLEYAASVRDSNVHPRPLASNSASDPGLVSAPAPGDLGDY
ncbi:hypothetical protein LIER_07916 [Lithospermum erythrorhizon]|uniref:Uncharacterized protein n=1 Tax=Lithospermum erythrorhizon TaxID=34254 RepID=A0AAV3PBN5_LITER